MILLLLILIVLEAVKLCRRCEERPATRLWNDVPVCGECYADEVDAKRQEGLELFNKGGDE